ncbi:MAG: TIGR03936 family radical SAM-associated protein [Pirellulales bacterium]|nr:TIGR03936 family radical SAM-associated protein [Pirellulales bacterium]
MSALGLGKLALPASARSAAACSSPEDGTAAEAAHQQSGAAHEPACQLGARQPPASAPSTRTRLRLRFRKLGLLRLIGHHDLVRCWERAFRRARLPLRMSQGFHPKPRLSFPAALALGVAGLDEVLEAELDAALAPQEVWQRLAGELPPGLELAAIEPLPPRGTAARVVRAHYFFPLPPPRRASAAGAAARLLGVDGPLLVPRLGRPPADLRATLADLEICGGILRFTIAAPPTQAKAAAAAAPPLAEAAAAATDASAIPAAEAAPAGTPRPRDVLAALGLDDLLDSGAYLTRTRVELAPPTP